MAKIIIHQIPIDLSLERIKRQLQKSPEERFHDLLRLNKFAQKMSGGKTMGLPQGRGIIIRKKNLPKD
jgi:hypothetical protein